MVLIFDFFNARLQVNYISLNFTCGRPSWGINESFRNAIKTAIKSSIYWGR
jgi:hypothetical protein